MIKLNKGILTGLLCFCFGYIAHDVAGDFKASMVTPAAAVTASAAPKVIPGPLAMPAHSYDHLGEDYLACHPTFRKAVETVIEFTVHSKSRYKNTKGRYLDKFCLRRAS